MKSSENACLSHMTDMIREYSSVFIVAAGFRLVGLPGTLLIASVASVKLTYFSTLATVVLRSLSALDSGVSSAVSSDMVEVGDIRWGGYDKWEGPYFYGTRKYSAPPPATVAEKMFDTVIRTEGGAPDLVNMYDRCKLSGGYFQWCESPYLLTTKLLNHIASRNPALMDPLRPALEASGAEFSPDAKGSWRFRIDGFAIESPALQEKVFFGGATGRKGSWKSEEQKDLARLWAASVANVLSDPAAEKIQIEYSMPRMMGFVDPSARRILFDDELESEGWIGAVRTGFVSFAGNLPAVASTQLAIAADRSSSRKWSPEWCVEVLKQLTFGPNIAIFPDRYDKIRPYLEKNYGVDLPDFADDLQAFRTGMGGGPEMYTVLEMQQTLIGLGYDLGPAGSDGRMGPKTKEALMAYQRSRGLKPDGVMGPLTRNALLKEPK